MRNIEDPTDEEIESILLAAPAERWRDLWRAVDEFEAESTHASWVNGRHDGGLVVDGVERPVFVMGHYRYSESVDRTIGALHALGAVVGFNWPRWDGVTRYRTGDGLDEAPVADAVRVMTAIIRAERFSDGAIAATIEDGTFPAALRRIRRWFEEEFPQS